VNFKQNCMIFNCDVIVTHCNYICVLMK